MAGRALERGGDLVQRAGDAAPRYDLKLSGLHRARRGENKSRSEQGIDRPFAHDAPLSSRRAAPRPLITRILAQLSALLVVPARERTRVAPLHQALGLYGFGAAAHILAQVAAWQGRRVYAFTRSGDEAAQAFAKSLGAVWAGGSDEMPPEPLDAAIIFAPVGALVPSALKAVKKGGRVVCGGIHMSDIPSFPYRLLWEERHIVSVANLTRADAREFLTLVPQAGVKTEITRYPLQAANDALSDLREGRLQGAAVLIP
jgi:D-arabinose 1-dehydrogenase-like Zn-dependent alcohol dehydrogenase